MTPIDTLQAVLSGTIMSPVRKLRHVSLTTALFGFAVIGLILGLALSYFQLSRQLNTTDRARTSLLSQSASSNAFRLMAELENDASRIEELVRDIIAVDQTREETARAIIDALDIFIADNDLVQGGRLSLIPGSPGLTFGISGRFASQSATPDARLSRAGWIDKESLARLSFVRLSEGQTGSLMVFSRHLDISPEASLFLVVPYSEFFGRTCAPNPGGDTCLLVDSAGDLINPTTRQREYWAQNARLKEQVRAFDHSEGPASEHGSSVSFGATVVAPVGASNLSVMTAARYRNPLQTLLRALVMQAYLLLPSVLAVLALAGFVQNEWQTRDTMISRFAEFARGADMALRLADVGVIFWRTRSHELYYTNRWFEQLGIDHFDPAASIDTLTGRLHPDDREKILRGYEAVMDGTQTEITRNVRLRNSDGEFVDMIERASYSKLDQEDILVILHRPSTLDL